LELPRLSITDLKVVLGAAETGSLFLPELLRLDDECDVDVARETFL